VPLRWFLRCSLIWYLETNVDGKLHIWYPSAELLQHCLPLSMVMNRLLQVLTNIFPCQRISLFLLVLDTWILHYWKQTCSFLCNTLSSFYLILLVAPYWSVTWDLCSVNSCWFPLKQLLLSSDFLNSYISSAHFKCFLCRTHTCPYLWMPSWGLLGSCLVLN